MSSVWFSRFDHPVCHSVRGALTDHSSLLSTPLCPRGSTGAPVLPAVLGSSPEHNHRNTRCTYFNITCFTVDTTQNSKMFTELTFSIWLLPAGDVAFMTNETFFMLQCLLHIFFVCLFVYLSNSCDRVGMALDQSICLHGVGWCLLANIKTYNYSRKPCVTHDNNSRNDHNQNWILCVN